MIGPYYTGIKAEITIKDCFFFAEVFEPHETMASAAGEKTFLGVRWKGAERFFEKSFLTLLVCSRFYIIF